LLGHHPQDVGSRRGRGSPPLSCGCHSQAETAPASPAPVPPLSSLLPRLQ
jgi:hypothetical protein